MHVYRVDETEVYTWVPFPTYFIKYMQTVPLLEECAMLGLQAFLITITQPTWATSATYLSQWPWLVSLFAHCSPCTGQEEGAGQFPVNI